MMDIMFQGPLENKVLNKLCSSEDAEYRKKKKEKKKKYSKDKRMLSGEDKMQSIQLLWTSAYNPSDCSSTLQAFN